MSSVPLLSIVTPTYNSMRFLPETAESIRRLDLPMEWIVVDNHSTDGTVDYLRGLDFPDGRLKIIVNPFNNGKPLLSWIKGARASRGKYMTNVGSDDIVPSVHAYCKALAFMEQHEDVGAAITRVGYMTDEGRVYKVKAIPFAKPDRVMSGERLFWTIFLSPTYPVKEGCTIYRRNLVERCNFTGDMELLLDMTRLTRFYLVDGVGLHYRNVRSSLSSSNRHDGFWLSLIDKYLLGDRYIGFRYFLYGYRMSIGFLKHCYRRFTPNRI